MLTLSAVDCGLGSNQRKFVFASSPVGSKNKDRLARNQDDVSQWVFTCGLLYQLANTIKIQLSLLVWYKVDIVISSNVTCSRHDVA